MARGTKEIEGIAPIANQLITEAMIFGFITAQRQVGLSLKEAIENFQDSCNPDPDTFTDRNVEASYQRLVPLYRKTCNFYKVG